MTNVSKLENTVKETYGKEAVVLQSTNEHAIIRFVKGDHLEFAVIRHNEESVFSGNYYSTVGQSEEEAKNSAWEKFDSLCDLNM